MWPRCQGCDWLEFQRGWNHDAVAVAIDALLESDPDLFAEFRDVADVCPKHTAGGQIIDNVKDLMESILSRIGPYGPDEAEVGVYCAIFRRHLEFEGRRFLDMEDER